MYWLLPFEIYLPIAGVVFVVAALLARRIVRPWRRSLVRGFVAALLFGGAGMPLGHGAAFVVPAWMMFVEWPWAWLPAAMFALPWLAVQTAVFAVIIHTLDRIWPEGALRAEWRKTVRELRSLRSATPKPNRPPWQWRWVLLPVVPVLLAGVAAMTIVIVDKRQDAERDATLDTPRKVSAQATEQPVEWQETVCNQRRDDQDACFRLLISAGALSGESISPPAPVTGMAQAVLEGHTPEGTQLMITNDSNGERFSISSGREVSITFKQGDRFHLRPALSMDVKMLAPDIELHEVE